MDEKDRENSEELTKEGKLIVDISKAIFAGNLDTAFRTLGTHMDQNGLKISREIIEEFKTGGLVKSAD